MLMRTIVLFILCMSFYGVSLAQRGEVTVVKDPLIDSLIARRAEVYKAGTEVKTNKAIVSSFGFRVQVFYGSDRREIFNQQARFKNSYPKMNTYITYKEPNYYLRVGDFRSRLDAQRFMNEIKPAFPTLFIFREKINAPNLDTNTDDQK